MSEIKILERYIYPIKSLPGLRLAKLEIDEEGPVLDHNWMLVDEENNSVTLRQRPDLTLFRVSLGNFVEVTWKDGDSVDFGLTETEGEELKVKHLDNEFSAFEVSEEVSEWFSSKLDKKVRLVRKKDQRFVDSGSILVVSKASLDFLDMKIGKKTAVSRFRPNVIIDQVEAHEEDLLEGFLIGKVEFRNIEKASRCGVIQVNPLTGVLSDEPSKTLSSYRKEADGKIYFGSYYATSGVGAI